MTKQPEAGGIFERCVNLNTCWGIILIAPGVIYTRGFRLPRPLSAVSQRQ